MKYVSRMCTLMVARVVSCVHISGRMLARSWISQLVGKVQCCPMCVRSHSITCTRVNTVQCTVDNGQESTLCTGRVVDISAGGQGYSDVLIPRFCVNYPLHYSPHSNLHTNLTVSTMPPFPLSIRPLSPSVKANNSLHL